MDSEKYIALTYLRIPSSKLYHREEGVCKVESRDPLLGFL